MSTFDYIASEEAFYTTMLRPKFDTFPEESLPFRKQNLDWLSVWTLAQA